MTSVRKSRYAVWHHHSQVIGNPIIWRETPRSKEFVSVVPPSVVPGQVEVLKASENAITVKLDKMQCQAVEKWSLGNLPDTVLGPTACETGILEHSGSYNIFNSPSMKYCTVPPPTNHAAMIRVVPQVKKLGPVYKTHLVVTDVLYNDVTAA